MPCDMKTRLLFLLVSLSFSCLFFSMIAAPVELHGAADIVYVGTYTERDSKGVYAFKFDADTGELKPIALAAEARNPSFMAIDAAGRHIYLVNEIDEFQGKADGSITAFAIDPSTHKLKELNAVASGGTGPAYISLDKTGQSALVANYGGGSIASIRVMPDGRLGESISIIQLRDQAKARIPHPHSIVASPDDRYAIVPDLGLDQIAVYEFVAATGKLAAANPPGTPAEAQAGPRHFKFHPSGRFGYVSNELSSSITVYSYYAIRGVLTPIQTISIKPERYEGDNTAAEVAVHPSGKYVYASNRGHDSIAVFSVDRKTGKLAFVEHVSTGGKQPRHFAIDPTGKWLLVANQQSDNIRAFRIDQKSGRLKDTGKSAAVSMPVFVLFAPENPR